MILRNWLALLLSIAILLIVQSPIGQSAEASISDVKITPLGSHEGEFCALDRALVFEDPNGLRILLTSPGTSLRRRPPLRERVLNQGHGDHLADRRIAEVKRRHLRSARGNVRHHAKLQ